MLILEPCHHHGLQKRLPTPLLVVVITISRPEPLSICIKRQACEPVGSDYYDIDFFIHFMRSFKVGGTGRNYTREGHSEGKAGPLAHHHVAYLKQ